jgi:hypothetical protein
LLAKRIEHELQAAAGEDRHQREANFEWKGAIGFTLSALARSRVDDDLNKIVSRLMAVR